MAKKNNKLIWIIGIIVVLFAFSDWESGTQTCNPVWNPDSAYDSVTFCTSGEALAKADEIGCDGFHMHQQDGETIYMSCNQHSDLDPLVQSAY